MNCYWFLWSGDRYLVSRVTVFVFPCQTAEEIEQLTVDEDLNDIERAVYLLRWVLQVRSNQGAAVLFMCVGPSALSLKL